MLRHATIAVPTSAPSRPHLDRLQEGMRALRTSVPATIGLALVALTFLTVPAWAAGTSIPSDRQATLPPTLVIRPVLADFVLSVTDNPTCDSNGRAFACNDFIEGCTATAGSDSVVTIQISGRQHPGPEPPLQLGQHGGRPFSVARSLLGCFSLSGYTASLDVDDTQRLTETSLLQLLEVTADADEPPDTDNLRYQPFPPAVAADLLREFHLSSGIPVISRFIAPTVDRHDGDDPLPTTLRATVEISVLGP